MKKIFGLSALALILGVTAASAQYRTHFYNSVAGRGTGQSWSQRLDAQQGPYHQDVLPDGTVTGPLGTNNPNG